MKNLTLFRAIETPSDPPEDHIILCGFGEVGFEAAISLLQRQGHQSISIILPLLDERLSIATTSFQREQINLPQVVEALSIGETILVIGTPRTEREWRIFEALNAQVIQRQAYCLWLHSELGAMELPNFTRQLTGRFLMKSKPSYDWGALISILLRSMTGNYAIGINGKMVSDLCAHYPFGLACLTSSSALDACQDALNKAKELMGSTPQYGCIVIFEVGSGVSLHEVSSAFESFCSPRAGNHTWLFGLQSTESLDHEASIVILAPI
ncbi:MAG: hypothetical protein A2527_01105 [Candidatus Lambdaproteobacteria bacterium RIFOXYD2_FULL_50_16]|uniref:Uncharacterized protein n=1 Tax=Candidatus Lambdaproteobacteria bacterium RIFOXYD2_FULL_50_16 TaxID=1817772 RepID=A0A1F6G9L5_9PROT|nr:MAG: hypothetical protein A2527_01105 [Candidatus Lambdaproteobacteria bacterium RIFOXYD2_FULL_50_16]